jgi:hypothetical protein
MSHLIQFCVRFNYLQPILYHITLYNATLFSTFSILDMLEILTIHNNVYTFYVTVNLYRTAFYCHFWMNPVENYWLAYSVVGIMIMQIFKCQYLRDWFVSLVVSHFFWNL